MKILFICQANIGRSQMAEAYYNSFTKTKDASSAGILNLVKKYNGKPAQEIIQVMKEDGIDISQQKVKQVTESMVKNADRIIILCNKSFCPQFILQNPKVQYIEIEDPYRQGIEQIRKVRETIKKSLRINFLLG